MHWEDIVQLATQWPEVEQAVSYGEPSLKVRKSLLTRHRVDDDSLVLMDVPADERDHLIGMIPEAFFIEPHYAGHDIVLAHLGGLPPDIAKRLLERRWRNTATKRAVAQYDSASSRTKHSR